MPLVEGDGSKTMLIAAILSLLFVGLNASVLIKDLPKKVFEVDEVITIEWINEGCQPNDLLVVDLINDRPEVMIEPFVIIEGLFVKQNKYEWKIPRLIKSSGDYHLRVYVKGTQPVLVSKDFSIVNPNPMRQSTLNLLEPTGSADGQNLESTCLIGEQCFVLWDYPEWASTAMPKRVDVNLYAKDRLVLVIAVGIPVESKSFLWRVPDNLNFDTVYVVVSASGQALRSLKPGESYYLASAGYPFRLETRGEREARRMNNPKPIDFTAPGPITPTSDSSSGSNGFVDIPRPTYAGNPIVTGASTSASAAMKIEANLLATTVISVLFIVTFAF